MLSLLKLGNFLPESVFVENIMRYARKELSWEVDYNREALCQRKYRQLITSHPNTDGLYVPKVVDELSTKRVFTSEIISGIPVDKLENIDSISDQIKNRVAKQIFTLCLRYVVFEFQLYPKHIRTFSSLYRVIAVYGIGLNSILVQIY
jgi:aarF domain-containing kinase